MGLFSFKKERRFSELSYANPNDSKLRRWIIHFIEDVSGRNHFTSIYELWRKQFTEKSDYMMNALLDMVDIKLHTKGQQWPPKGLPDAPLVMVANHPFGIADGIAILSMAEKLNRPCRILINNDLLKVPEIRSYSLPVNFEETKDALKMNMETRKEAVRLLQEGVTIIVFPGGGVATAKRVFGKADDLPWKMFPAKLIQSANASVIPVFFEGKNSFLFHLVSKFSLMLRLSLFIREFKRLCGKTITAHIGELIPSEELSAIKDRKEMTEMLHKRVFGLNPKQKKD